MLSNIKEKIRSVSVPIVLGVIALPGMTLALTVAGTEIKNLATVSYEDNNGISYSAQSNEAIVTVAEVHSATLEQDRLDIVGAPGQTVYIPHYLTNTGNATDSYTLSVADDSTPLTGDTADASSLLIYNDLNSNGQPDPGEPSVTSISLAADETASLIVAVGIGAAEADGAGIGVILTAVADSSATVDDVTAGNGVDGLEGTNQDLVTVSTDAVLVTTKESVDNGDGSVTYTLTVSNNGGADATDVNILDAIPWVDTNGDSVPDAPLTFLSVDSVFGILAVNGDTVPTAVVSLSEAVYNRDLNGDGDTADTVDGILAIDTVLPTNTTVSVSYTVQYDPFSPVLAAGTEISNTFCAAEDRSAVPDGDFIDPEDTVVCSNTTTDLIPQNYGVDADDTDGAGNDADAQNNDTQTVASASAGGLVVFENVITNLGNGTDIFELSIDRQGASNSGSYNFQDSFGFSPLTDDGAAESDPSALPADAVDFPAGTTFTFWDATNSVVLGDASGDGAPDTGSIAPGDSVAITVRAQLPVGFDDADAGVADPSYFAILTATSAGDGVSTDTKLERLNAIASSVIDISNSVNGAETDGDAGSAVGDEDPLLPGTYVPTTTYNAALGTQVQIPLYIDNESGASESFVIDAGASWDGATLGGLETGWSVQFFAGDGAGNPTGAATSNFGPFPAASFDNEVIAVITVPSDAALASADHLSDPDGDGTADSTVDANGSDGDGDYPVIFRVTSLSGAVDVKLDAVDVDPLCGLTLEPNGSNQINPGGTASYSHLIINNSNTAEAVSLSGTNSLAGDGWTHQILVPVDTDGNDVPDAQVEWSAITATSEVCYLQSDSSYDCRSFADGQVELQPGEVVEVTAIVFAPANAPNGAADTLSLTAVDEDGNGCGVLSVSDQTTVVDGQVRLEKSAAIDTDCDCVADTAFEAVQSTTVEPNQCVIWGLSAVNEGTSDANNVVVSDAMTEFSSMESATGACTDDTAGASPCDPLAGDLPNVPNSGVDPILQWNVGLLIPGDTARMQFCVRIE